MLPSLWFTNFDPIGPAVFTAVFGVATVALVYVWAKNWTDTLTSLYITGLIAVSPLVVRFTQWPWNPNTTGFFGMLFLLTLQAWRRRPRLWLSVVAGLLLGLLFQLHYFTIAIGAAALVVWWWQKPVVQKWLHAAAFILAAILPNLTFVIFDLTHDGFYRRILFASFDSSSSQNLFTFQLLHLLLSPPAYLWDVLSKLLASQVLGAIGLVLITIWGIETLRRAWRSRQASEEFHLVAAWIVFLLMTSFFPTVLDDYHSTVLWVGLFTGLVMVTKRWWRTLHVGWQLVAFGGIFCFLFLQNRWWRSPTWAENMPVVREVGYEIAQDAAGKTEVNVASFVDSDTRATRFRYFITKENVSLQGVDQYPSAQILYVVTPHDWEETRQNPAWELETFRNAEATQLWHDHNWILYRVEK